LAGLSRKEMLIARRVRPEHCQSSRASMRENKEWARANLYIHPGEIDVSSCPSFEAWNLLISYEDRADAFSDYAKVGTTKEEVEQERRRLFSSAVITRHLERAQNAFQSRQASGDSLN
jgi:hypothetical protein